MLVDIAVKVRDWWPKPPNCFQPRCRDFKTGYILTFEKYIFEKKGLLLYLEQKIEKHHSENIDLQANIGPPSFFETKMLSALFSC